MNMADSKLEYNSYQLYNLLIQASKTSKLTRTRSAVALDTVVLDTECNDQNYQG